MPKYPLPDTGTSFINQSLWHFDTSVFQDQEFNTVITRELTSSMEVNDSPNASLILLWQTGKVY